MVLPKRIYYHGTGPKEAKQILQEGFKPDTYFAYHLEDAIGYGGSHVFGVALSSRRNKDNWQFVVKRRVPPNRIVFYRVFRVKEVMLNPLLREEVLESNIPREERPLARKEFEIEQTGLPLKERMKKIRKLRKEFQEKESRKE